MRAEIIAVGSELLTPLRADTNALVITRRLLEVGVAVVARHTVADDAALLVSTFREALQRSEVVICTGGLGPTEDDLTREAAAAATGRSIHRDASIVEALRARFAQFGRVMAAVNEKQGDVIDGAAVLANRRGTAPGQRIETPDDRLLFLLPGPPPEMEAMLAEHVLPPLQAKAGGRLLRTRVLKIAAMSESDVEQLAAPVYKQFQDPQTTILGAAGQVELHLVASGASEREVEEGTEALAAGLRKVLAGRIFSEDGRELNEVVAALLRERGLTLALAESCTGGKLASRLTDIPGSSAYLKEAWVTYANEAKTARLGVPAALIEEHGAVSEPVAAAMARGARETAAADIGMAITGIAGPDGGSEGKPVGLVYLAMDGAAGTRVRRAVFPGDRARVRQQAVQSALEMLRRELLGLGAP